MSTESIKDVVSNVIQEKVDPGKQGKMRNKLKKRESDSEVVVFFLSFIYFRLKVQILSQSMLSKSIIGSVAFIILASAQKTNGCNSGDLTWFADITTKPTPLCCPNPFINAPYVCAASYSDTKANVLINCIRKSSLVHHFEQKKKIK